jgi:hypothetical protein
MILLPLMLLAAALQPAPTREPPARTLSTTTQMVDLCDAGIDEFSLSPASLPDDPYWIPQAWGDEADPSLEEPGPDDGYAPDEYPEEEQCPMLFVIPFDFWDGDLWFDASGYGPSV